MTTNRFFLSLLAFFIAALLFGALLFLTGMNGSAYLVNDGVRNGIQYLDKPRYDSNLQGLIFALVFLAAGLLVLLMVILPNHETAAETYQPAPPPQPRRRAAPAAPAPAPQPAPAARPRPAPAQPAPATAQPAPATAQPAAEAVPPPAAPPAQTVELEAEEPPPPPAPAPPPEPQGPTKSVEEEVLSGPDTGDFEDLPDSGFVDSGENDVVYGTGRVTDDSVWDFIQTYPDSAVKFLYRKTLENKALAPTEEDIYRRWEIRGMNRSKVREIVLEIMGWKTLPDDFPHNIWRDLRDQIFDMKSRVASPSSGLQ